MKKLVLVAVLLFAALYGFRAFSRSRTVQAFGTIVPRVETDRRVVALTFDDGPTAAALEAVLAPLRREQVKATFFVCGAQVAESPAAAAKLVSEGHELGNHSWSHQRMWFKSQAFYAREFERTDAAIRAAGHRGPIHVRAPYCKKLVGLPWYFAKHDRVHVTFDVEPESDAEIDADTRRIVAHVLDHVRPGSIILLHPWYRGRERAREAVPLIIAGLKQAGYEFVTVNELLKLKTT